MEETLNRKDRIVMKLLHYFITEKNYNPIILQGAEDEIWLENLNGDYRIIRIVSNHIHNDEQLDFDAFKTSRIVKKIKWKTFSLRMNVLSIYTDLGDNAHIDQVDNMTCMYLYDEKDIEKYDFFEKTFPDIENKLDFHENGLQLFMKITNDINEKNKTEALKAEDIFKKKKPLITPILITLNVLCYFIPILFGLYEDILNSFCVYGPLIRYGQFYRLLTGIFLHGDILHLLFNCYALYVIGSQLEGFMGKTKYLFIYLFSGLMGSLFSIALNGDVPSIGASGAIFGLMGSLLYFGYHYRVYLGGVLKSQIIPLIIFNLLLGFLNSTIDNFAHIGGLIGGFLITIALGVKYKSTKFEMINGFIVSILFTIFMAYMGICMVG
ncbi:MAG: rhomboid family intramembrane serine protease [Firmicutes bacterium]|nr:rhomboid family intramembrane serine protease [Bacillota bacterium]